MNYLLYLAHGGPRFLYQAAFSILSLLRVLEGRTPHDTRIVVYTDCTEFFTKLFGELCFFSCERLEAHQILAYRGPVDFVHRIKIRLLQEFLRTHRGNVIYVDADTVFLKDPYALFHNLSQDQFIMHLKEQSQSCAFMRFLRKLDDLVARGDLPLPGRPALRLSSVAMWNCGVVGLNSENATILDAVLTMTDAIVRRAPEKPGTIKWVSEQFAFSYMFQAHGAILAANEYIYHYWDFKYEFHSILLKFFAHYDGRSLVTMIEATGRILLQELYRPKWEHHLLTRLRKIVRKLRGIVRKLRGKL